VGPNRKKPVQHFDIGTELGYLMLAQRSNAEQIDALEIDRCIRTRSIILKTLLIDRLFFSCALDDLLKNQKTSTI
jgi:hypothetical protein